LLSAELGKLRRPLTWGVTGAAALFCVLLAVGGAHNAQAGAQAAGGPLPSCAALGVPAGPACTAARTIEQVRYRQRDAALTAAAVHTAAQLNPIAAGAEAAGLMASLPGALALALLAGGHIGGEWSGRTMKTLLTQHGRRWQVLGAKLVSLWLAGIGLIAACWAALAAAGPILTRVDHLPAAHQGAGPALALAGSQVARALLVLAAFAAIGLLAAVVTRNTIGTTATTAGVFVAMLVIATLPGLGRWTPATWMQGWMGFPVGIASITALPSNFWSRFISAGGSAPSQLLGLVGLCALLLACGAVSARIFQRADISG
jgi:ABC-type transport system involved in multi-copper enzyme maturation permease subunit